MTGSAYEDQANPFHGTWRGCGAERAGVVTDRGVCGHHREGETAPLPAADQHLWEADTLNGGDPLPN